MGMCRQWLVGCSGGLCEKTPGAVSTSGTAGSSFLENGSSSAQAKLLPQPSTAADHSSLCTSQLKAALFPKLLAVSITLFSDTQQLETQKGSMATGIT